MYRIWQSLINLQMISSFPNLWFYMDTKLLLKEELLAPGQVSRFGVDLGGTSINRWYGGVYNSSSKQAGLSKEGENLAARP